MTPIQAARARALADAHGHSWGLEESTRGLLEPEEIDAAIPHGTTCEGRECSIPCPRCGITGPVLGSDGAARHTTGSGRTSWTVWPSGQVEIVIRRPTGVALRAVVGATAETYGPHLSRAEEPAEERHGDALLMCLGAILAGGPVGADLAARVLDADGIAHSHWVPPRDAAASAEGGDQ